MRAVILVVAAGVAAPTVGLDGVPSSPVQPSEPVTAIVTKTRAALGGDERLASVTALVVEGSFRRVMGPREMEGTITLTLGQAGQIRHEEELRLPGGGSVTRLAGMNGDQVWEDTATRGGLGGGPMVFRGGGPGPGGRDADPDARRERQRQRLTALYERMALALFASGDDLSYAGVADVAGGQAHVFETTDPAGRPVRLFISQDAHVPLGISYMDVRPVVMGAGRPGMRADGPGMTGNRRRQAEPPSPSSIVMRLEDYRRVDGLQLPHLFVQTIDGEPTEEWTVTRYQVNPRLEADVFDRK